ncbi:gamma-glutamylcyclotransferase family protein [Pseudonocardia spinosispora]|uniref:gamma-glutamylcyclotransferase family protein n=1 Tax=Pseudonocardia spinosispora TaxID=103441 RepID=UPI0012EC423B|nr:gamma-glutamylcyclotransferase family protein [Pseudonocardia spinosispora]
MAADPDILLFSYGTLRQAEVQLSTFGRPLDGWLETVPGYRLDWITITDPDVIRASGSDRHPMLIASSEPGASVEGMVFRITAAELAASTPLSPCGYWSNLARAARSMMIGRKLRTRAIE